VTKPCNQADSAAAVVLAAALRRSSQQTPTMTYAPAAAASTARSSMKGAARIPLTASKASRWCAASPNQAAHTRFGCTWRTGGTRWWATRFTELRGRGLGGRRCMRARCR
jgi:hypothetical protein